MTTDCWIHSWGRWDEAVEQNYNFTGDKEGTSRGKRITQKRTCKDCHLVQIRATEVTAGGQITTRIS